jgi:hypothetical protein
LANRCAILGNEAEPKENSMAKGKDSQKSVKKKSEKTLKEKRKEKKDKKGKGSSAIK